MCDRRLPKAFQKETGFKDNSQEERNTGPKLILPSSKSCSNFNESSAWARESKTCPTVWKQCPVPCSVTTSSGTIKGLHCVSLVIIASPDLEATLLSLWGFTSVRSPLKTTGLHITSLALEKSTQEDKTFCCRAVAIYLPEFWALLNKFSNVNELSALYLVTMKPCRTLLMPIKLAIFNKA